MTLWILKLSDQTAKNSVETQVESFEMVSPRFS
jgi:hypothetical protein